MNKRWKIALIVVIFLIITNIFSANHVSAIEMTKENLKSSLLKISDKLTLYTGNRITVEDDVIKVEQNGKTYEIKYDLSSNPTFTTEFEVNKGMTYSEFSKEAGAEGLPMIGYIGAATIGNAKFRDVMLYAMTMYAKAANTNRKYTLVDDENGQGIVKQESSTIIYASDFPMRGIEYVKDAYAAKKVSSDESYINSYTWTIERKDESDTKCRIISTLVINPNADFAKLSEELTETNTSDNNTATNNTTATKQNNTTTNNTTVTKQNNTTTNNTTATKQNNTTSNNTTVTSTNTTTESNDNNEKVLSQSNSVKISSVISQKSDTNATEQNTVNTANTANTTETAETSNSANNTETLVLPYAGQSSIIFGIVVIAMISVGCLLGYMKNKEF